jgi:hypothetical protein
MLVHLPQVLVFCTMTRLLDVLEEHLDWRGITHLRLDGATPSAERGSLVPPCPAPWSFSQPVDFLQRIPAQLSMFQLLLSPMQRRLSQQYDWHP